jgi:peptidoglycan/LPS O-acetylase OafA/YrhL
MDAAASGLRKGVPAAGSLIQSFVAVLTIVVFAVAGVDPVGGMFTWLSALAALGVLTLMVGSCAAVVRFYASRGAQSTSPWQRLLAPTVSGVALLGTLVLTTANLDSLVGPGDLRWLLPAVLVIGALSAVGWGIAMQSRRPGAFAAIGRGQPQPLAIVDRQLSSLEL